MRLSRLFRGFFPSWEFFDVVATEFRLEARFGEGQDGMCPWLDCLPLTRRSAVHILLNPIGNYRLACRTHLSLLSNDILQCENPNDLERLGSYKITRNLAEYQLVDLYRATRPFVFQFRLLATDADPILVSTVHEVER